MSSDRHDKAIPVTVGVAFCWGDLLNLSAPARTVDGCSTVVEYTIEGADGTDMKGGFGGCPWLGYFCIFRPCRTRTAD
jgi:hypothetical protein